ncbi:hypothetical protein LZK73_21855 [Neorhizobium galegae]|nr:hypothetical protein LZK73_21855 [Neorhizobium galegae]
MYRSGEASGKALFLTTNKRNVAYLYQWYNQGTDRVQSAWNRITFPATNTILWTTVDGDTAYFLLQWSGVVTLRSVKLDGVGDEPDATFPLRLDHRLSEANAVFDGDHFVLTLPYPVPAGKQSLFSCFEREDVPNVSQRGRKLDIVWVNTTTLHVIVSDPTRRFYFGSIPVARRKFTRFYARDRNDQPVIHDKLLLKSCRVSHKDTVEYEVRVEKSDGTVTTQTYTGRVLGDPTLTNNEVPIRTGSFKADINAETEDATIELANPSPFPCVWTAAKFVYESTLRTP